MTASGSARLRRIARGLAPAIAAVPMIEAMRAGLGALVGLGVVGLFLLSPTVDLQMGLYLIAPFGATSVLIFAVPNSPLAQPWSAVVGNTLGAVVGVAAVLSIGDPVLRTALAVGLTIAITGLARAVHPPAGAVAMTATLSPDHIEEIGFWFALAPVAVGTALLVLFGIAYAHGTGRKYPFRQFEETNPQGTNDTPPFERLGLSEHELTDILQSHRQSLNVGAEDLARLIGAAELQAAIHHTGPMVATDIMSRDLVSVDPEAPLSHIADLFRQHGFTSLPVVQEGDKFLGIIFQIHLIRRAREDALRLDHGFGAAMTRLLDRNRDAPALARDIMAVALPRATLRTPIGALLPLLADGNCDALPVLARGRIVGIITKADLIAALIRQRLRPK